MVAEASTGFLHFRNLGKHDSGGGRPAHDDRFALSRHVVAAWDTHDQGRIPDKHGSIDSRAKIVHAHHAAVEIVLAWVFLGRELEILRPNNEIARVSNLG